MQPARRLVLVSQLDADLGHASGTAECLAGLSALLGVETAFGHDVADSDAAARAQHACELEAPVWRRAATLFTQPCAIASQNREVHPLLSEPMSAGDESLDWLLKLSKPVGRSGPIRCQLRPAMG